jgi:beta-lactam-binding protein with PASTA domain
VNLVVSRGPVVDRVGDYVGKDLNELRTQLQGLYTSGRPLISIADPPTYVYDKAEPGLILEQKPLPDTEISGPTELVLVVSRGPEAAKVAVPHIKGGEIGPALALLEKANLTVIATMKKAGRGEAAGTVLSVSPAPGTEVPSGSAVNLVVTEPGQDLIGGIFIQDLPAYPYPLRLVLEVIKPSGEKTALFRVNHPGGRIAIPYAVPADSNLILSVLDREVARIEVKKP